MAQQDCGSQVLATPSFRRDDPWTAGSSLYSNGMVELDGQHLGGESSIAVSFVPTFAVLDNLKPPVW